MSGPTAVTALIRAPETAFVVVSSPHHDTIDEAVWFAEQLVEQGVGGEGTGAELVIVNRMHPAFGAGSADDAARSGRQGGGRRRRRSRRAVGQRRPICVRPASANWWSIAPLGAIAGWDRVVVRAAARSGRARPRRARVQIAGHLVDADR